MGLSQVAAAACGDGEERTAGLMAAFMCVSPGGSENTGTSTLSAQLINFYANQGAIIDKHAVKLQNMWHGSTG
jgi:hypothetical protein